MHWSDENDVRGRFFETNTARKTVPASKTRVFSAEPKLNAELFDNAPIPEPAPRLPTSRPSRKSLNDLSYSRKDSSVVEVPYLSARPDPGAHERKSTMYEANDSPKRASAPDPAAPTQASDTYDLRTIGLLKQDSRHTMPIPSSGDSRGTKGTFIPVRSQSISSASGDSSDCGTACCDLRCHQPRLLPPLSRWDRRNPPEALKYPVANPEWLKQFQRKLPWAEITERSQGGPWLSPPGKEFKYSSLSQEMAARWRVRGDRHLLLIRCSLFGIMILTLFILNIVLAEPLTTAENVTIIWDRMHEAFKWLNRLLQENKSFFSGFMFIGATLMDILVIVQFGYWALLGDSLRLPIAYGLLYTVRAFMRYMNILPFPDGYVWGFPMLGKLQWRSLTVPMVPADDFFYSGHVGCATLSTIEHVYNNFWPGVYYNIVVIIYTCVLMWGTRGHYTIDLLSGAVFAWWVWCLGVYFARYLDQWSALPPRPLVDAQRFHEKLQLRQSHCTCCAHGALEKRVSADHNSHYFPASPNCRYSAEKFDFDVDNGDGEIAVTPSGIVTFKRGASNRVSYHPTATVAASGTTKKTASSPSHTAPCTPGNENQPVSPNRNNFYVQLHEATTPL